MTNRPLFFDIEAGGFKARESSILSIAYGTRPSRVKPLYSPLEEKSVYSPWVQKNVIGLVEDDIAKNPNFAYQSERSALKEFLADLRQEYRRGNRTLAGWNIGYEVKTQRKGVHGYDIPMLLSRAEKYGLKQEYTRVLNRFKIRDVGQESAYLVSKELMGNMGVKLREQGLIDEDLYKQVSGYAEKGRHLRWRTTGQKLSDREAAERLAKKGVRMAGWKQELIYDALFPDKGYSAHSARADVKAGYQILQEIDKRRREGQHNRLIFRTETDMLKWAREAQLNKLVSSAMHPAKWGEFAPDKFSTLVKSAQEMEGKHAIYRGLERDFRRKLRENVQDRMGDRGYAKAMESIVAGQGIGAEPRLIAKGGFKGLRAEAAAYTLNNTAVALKRMGRLGLEAAKSYKIPILAGAAFGAATVLKPLQYLSGDERSSGSPELATTIDVFNVRSPGKDRGLHTGTQRAVVSDFIRKQMEDESVAEGEWGSFNKVVRLAADKNIGLQVIDRSGAREILDDAIWWKNPRTLNRVRPFITERRNLGAMGSYSPGAGILRVGGIIDPNEMATAIPNYVGSAGDEEQARERTSMIYRIARPRNMEATVLHEGLHAVWDLELSEKEKEPFRKYVRENAPDMKGDIKYLGDKATAYRRMIEDYRSLNKWYAFGAGRLRRQREDWIANELFAHRGEAMRYDTNYTFSKNKELNRIAGSYINWSKPKQGLHPDVENFDPREAVYNTYSREQMARDAREAPKTVLHPGVGLFFNQIPGKDDFYNVIEGLSEGGMAGAMRKVLTDFGSGYRGLVGIPARLEKYFSGLAGYTVINPSQFQKQITDQIMTSGPKGFKNRLKQAPGKVKDMVALSSMELEMAKSPMKAPILINRGVIREMAEETGASPIFLGKQVIAHERWHQLTFQSGVDSAAQRFPVPSAAKKLIMSDPAYASYKGKEHLLGEEYLAISASLYKSGHQPLPGFEKGVEALRTAPALSLRVPGKDDAHNTIQGFQEKGFASRMRKWLTDFGSGYQGPRVNIQDILENSDLSSPEERFKIFRQAIHQYGQKTGTGHKRIYVPGALLSRKEIERDLGFIPVKIAVPESGQSTFTSWRHPLHNVHIHKHKSQWTFHEDDHASMTMLIKRLSMGKHGKDSEGGIASFFGSLGNILEAGITGIPHIITEGVPGMFYWARGQIMGSATMMERLKSELPGEYKDLLQTVADKTGVEDIRGDIRHKIPLVDRSGPMVNVMHGTQYQYLPGIAEKGLLHKPPHRTWEQSTKEREGWYTKPDQIKRHEAIYGVIEGIKQKIDMYAEASNWGNVSLRFPVRLDDPKARAAKPLEDFYLKSYKQNIESQVSLKKFMEKPYSSHEVLVGHDVAPEDITAVAYGNEGSPAKWLTLAALGGFASWRLGHKKAASVIAGVGSLFGAGGMMQGFSLASDRDDTIEMPLREYISAGMPKPGLDPGTLLSSIGQASSLTLLGTGLASSKRTFNETLEKGFGKKVGKALRWAPMVGWATGEIENIADAESTEEGALRTARFGAGWAGWEAGGRAFKKWGVSNLMSGVKHKGAPGVATHIASLIGAKLAAKTFDVLTPEPKKYKIEDAIINKKDELGRQEIPSTFNRERWNQSHLQAMKKASENGLRAGRRHTDSAGRIVQ